MNHNLFKSSHQTSHSIPLKNSTLLYFIIKLKRLKYPQLYPICSLFPLVLSLTPSFPLSSLSPLFVSLCLSLSPSPPLHHCRRRKGNLIVFVSYVLEIACRLADLSLSSSWSNGPIYLWWLTLSFLLLPTFSRQPTSFLRSPYTFLGLKHVLIFH